jgi:hypothetical protein
MTLTPRERDWLDTLWRQAERDAHQERDRFRGIVRITPEFHAALNRYLQQLGDQP